MESHTSQDQATTWLDARYRQVIEQVDDYAIFTLDNEGLVSTWNEGAERILGFSEEEALGQPSGFIFTPRTERKANTNGSLGPLVVTAKLMTSAGTCVKTAAASMPVGY